MNRHVLLWVSICAVLLAGCRVVSLGKSVARTQRQTAEGVLYTDSLFTDDGQSRLTERER
ncbi:MAG: hypothetical protein PHN82_06675 [bacterium]|nr:hypothetical protein [bacterium]